MIPHHQEGPHFSEVVSRMSRSIAAVKELSTRAVPPLRREFGRAD